MENILDDRLIQEFNERTPEKPIKNKRKSNEFAEQESLSEAKSSIQAAPSKRGRPSKIEISIY